MKFDQLEAWYREHMPVTGEIEVATGTRFWRGIPILRGQELSEVRLRAEPFFWSSTEEGANDYALGFQPGGDYVVERVFLATAKAARPLRLALARTFELSFFLMDNHARLGLKKAYATEMQRLYSTAIFRHFERVEFDGVWQDLNDILIADAGDAFAGIELKELKIN